MRPVEPSYSETRRPPRFRRGFDGDALGRLLDSAHRSVSDHDPVAAKALADRILRASDKRDDVSAVQDHLRAIGARQSVDPAQSQAALDAARKHPTSQDRELLLALAAKTEATADAFLQAAEKAFPKEPDERDPFKNPEKKFHAHDIDAVKNFFETEAAWDSVVKADASSDATIRNRAQTVTEQVMRALGDGEHLDDPARKGLARALGRNLGDLAAILTRGDTTAGAAALEGFNVSAEQVRATLKEIAKDKDALGQLIASFGATLAGPYATVAHDLAAHIPVRTPDMKDEEWQATLSSAGVAAAGTWGDTAKQMGTLLCGIADAARQSGLDQQKAAIATLANFRLGVDIALDLIPGAAQVEKGIKAVTSKIPDKDVQGFEGKVKDDIAGLLSGIDDDVLKEGKETAIDTRKALQTMITENMMATMARDPVLLSRLGTQFPDFMLQTPGQPMPVPVADPPPPHIPPGYLKAEYTDPGGGAKIPLPGSAHYQEFRKWAQPKSPAFTPLYVTAQAAAEPIHAAASQCMGNILWDQAAEAPR